MSNQDKNEKKDSSHKNISEVDFDFKEIISKSLKSIIFGIKKFISKLSLYPVYAKNEFLWKQTIEDYSPNDKIDGEIKGMASQYKITKNIFSSLKFFNISKLICE